MDSQDPWRSSTILIWVLLKILCRPCEDPQIFPHPFLEDLAKISRILQCLAKFVKNPPKDLKRILQRPSRILQSHVQRSLKILIPSTVAFKSTIPKVNFIQNTTIFIKFCKYAIKISFKESHWNIFIIEKIPLYLLNSVLNINMQ